MNICYFDHNATAPIRPAARAAFCQALDILGNPSSVHRFGRASRRLVEDARENVAGWLGLASNEIIFTASGTEANHLALRGVGHRPVIVSSLEHSSVLEAVDRPMLIRATPQGIIDLAHLAALMTTHPGALVSIMAANNETGIIQPLGDAAALIHDANGILHVDATQIPGRIEIAPFVAVADLLTLSGHKIGAGYGAAVLTARDNIPLEPQLRGGGQELRRRAGTENVPAIAALSAAISELRRGFDARPIEQLRDALADRLQDAGGVLTGNAAPRLPNTLSVAMPGVMAETQVIAFDLAGYAVSAGAACSSGKVTLSPTLTAMGLDPALVAATIRISLGFDNTEDEISGFATAWRDLAERQRGRAIAA